MPARLVKVTCCGQKRTGFPTNSQPSPHFYATFVFSFVFSFKFAIFFCTPKTTPPSILVQLTRRIITHFQAADFGSSLGSEHLSQDAALLQAPGQVSLRSAHRSNLQATKQCQVPNNEGFLVKLNRTRNGVLSEVDTKMSFCRNKLCSQKCLKHQQDKRVALHF